MTHDDPGNQAAPKRQSLIDLIAAAPAGRTAAPARIVAWLVPGSLLLLWLPLAVWIGARWLESDVTAEVSAIRRADRPAAQARALAAAEHRMLGQMMAQPGAATRIEAMAVALPPDDRLIAIDSGLDGELAIEVLTVDPARLRSALREPGAVAPFRTRSERREDGAFRVVLNQAAR